MNNHEAYYGGSLGPPESDSRPLQHPQYGHYFQQSNNLYNRSHQGNQPDTRGNVTNANYVPGFNDGWMLYPYESPQNSFFTASPSVRCHYFNHSSGSIGYDTNFGYNTGLSSGVDYTEWSTNDCPSNIEELSLSESYVDENTGIQDFTSSNESVGKSRRFSRQRNTREKSIAGKTNSAVYTRTSSQSSKHEIRFSHQKNSSKQSTTGVYDESKSEASDEKSQLSATDDQNVDGKFAIIKSIGKREIDTGFTSEDQQNVKSKTKLVSRIQHGVSGIQSSDSQIGVLMNQLSSGSYECMVCCDRVRQQHAIWNCGKCFHVFHMGCIKKWARSPAAKVEGEGWRCPGCQNLTKKYPNIYLCFCGKVKEPLWNHHETPHSCGEVCGKKRSDSETCTHPCNILCHPGPCPPCPASVMKNCLCGNLTQKVRCSDKRPLICDEICGKKRKCGLHVCNSVCHVGECTACQVLIVQVCFCGKSRRNVYCGTIESKVIPSTDNEGVYSCEKICQKDLSCSNHKCSTICHRGPCESCPLAPSAVTMCPCLQTKLSDILNEDGSNIKRISCLDQVPVCDKVCNKQLECGGDDIHTCKLKCHLNECPPCIDGDTKVKCRCGKSEKDVPCSKIPHDPYTCDRRCNKKRKCGRHKCGKTCCTDLEHACMQVCGRKLSCKLHRCEDICHRGNCYGCYNVSFDELTCHCGSQVLYPPIPCGTKPPECSNVCVREHPCHHTVSHSCHNEDKCPPCVVLVRKKCNCGKMIRSNIPCHQENVSCGAPCKKSLICGHQCLKPCHPGSCMNDIEMCTQPCSIMRVECIHPCASPCHYGKPCPPNPCKAVITLKCSCGNLEKQVECSAGGAVYHRIASEAFARQQHMSHTNSVDISSFFRETGKQKILPCSEECSVKERNRRFAEALQINDKDDIGDSGSYSSSLQQWVKIDPAFIRSTEQELTSLIESVEWMDKHKRDFMFPSMKREKRRVIHELAEVFKCKSLSCDEEPNRSVLVTAVKGFSIVPRILPSESVRIFCSTIPCLNAVESHSATRKPTERGKRLLSSMKLVSMSSSPSSNYSNKSPQVNMTTKRPTMIPRMPTYSVTKTTGKGISCKGNFVESSSKTQYGSYQIHKQGSAHLKQTSDNKDLCKSHSEVDVQSTSGSRVPADHTHNVSACERNIDYFDMTG